MSAELDRLNAVVERLGGEAAESRSVMLARIEALTEERERTVGDLQKRLTDAERSKAESSHELATATQKMRNLSLKALSAGTVKTGRDRQQLYWESMKNAHARPDAISWRTDKDESAMSRQIDLEHKLTVDTHLANLRNEAAAEELKDDEAMRAADSAGAWRRERSVGALVTPAGATLSWPADAWS